nr:hypothetical protein [bacterium]
MLTSYYQDNSPAPRKNNQMVLLIVAGSLLPVLLFIGYKQMSGGSKDARTLPKSFATKTELGKPLTWRVLDKRALLGDSIAGGLLAGNFDNDVDEELLRIGPSNCRSYDWDGASHSMTLGGAIFSRGLTAWDYDSNGIDEIVPDPRLYAL